MAQMADSGILDGETQEHSFSSLSRSSTQSFDNSEKVISEDISSKSIPVAFKSLSLSSKFDSFKDVEGVWSNKDVWVVPPSDVNDEVMGSSLVDEYDDEDDEEGIWKKHSSPETIRSGSDYLHSKIKLRAKLERDFLLAVERLLQDEGIPKGEEGDPNSWLQIVSNLALQAATNVKPNTNKGGVMDPGEYVKVKCVASGECADSTLVKGVVCHKNVQHRRMMSRFKNPKLLLLGGALEYQRSQNQLSSLVGVLQQEIDYLTTTLGRIDALHPNVLLVEKTVAGFAQDTLLNKEVSVVLKVKRPLLERIARCTGAHVIQSLDNLVNVKAGQCEQFRIEKYEEDLNVGVPGTKKTSKYLMFFEGCPRPLGCTIILRGASTEELKKVKKAVKLAVFHAYHLSLETSFLADEGVMPPSNPLQCIPSSKRSSSDSCISTIAGFTPPASRVPSHGRSDSLNNLAVQKNHVQAEDVGGGMSQRGSSDSLEAQQFAEFTTEDFPPSSPDHQSIVVYVSKRTMSKGTVCGRPQLRRIKYYGSSDMPIGSFLREFLGNVSKTCPDCDEPMEEHEHRFAHSRGCLTLYCKVTRGHSLPGEKEGQVWMWHRCLRCPRPDGIPPPTRRVPLSDSAQNISFGKFLQLSFSEQAVETIASCGHYVYRDCLRFFGMGVAVACLLYNPIKLLSVSVPPPQLEFNLPSEQGWLKVETQEIVELGVNLFAAARDQLNDLSNYTSKLGPQLIDNGPGPRGQLAELENLLQREREDFEEQLHMAAPLKEGASEPIADILALNKLRRHLALVYNTWDLRVKELCAHLNALQYRGRAAGLEINGPPPTTSSSSIPASVSEASGGSVSHSEGPPSESSSGDPVSPETESDPGMPEVPESKLSQLPEEVVSVAPEETNPEPEGADDLGPSAEQIDEDSDTLSDSAANGEVVGENPALTGESALDVVSNKPSTLGRQTSSPLPSSSLGTQTEDTDSPASGETAHPRSLSEGHFPIMVDLPDTLEAAWRGEGGFKDAVAVDSRPEVAEDPLAPDNVVAFGGQEAEVSDLTAMTTPSSQPEADDSEEVVETSGEDDLEQSRLTSPSEDKEEVNLAVSRPTSPLNDKEVPEESGGVTGAPLSSSSYKGYKSSSLMQSNSIVYNAPYNRSNTTVPKVKQFFLQGVARVRLPPGVNGTVVAVYEDEPTTVIAYAITSPEYQRQIQDPVQEILKDSFEERESSSGAEDWTSPSDFVDDGMRSTTPPLDLPGTPRGRRAESSIDRALTSPTPLTVKLRFTDYGDTVKSEFQVNCYYAKQFIALRARCCGGEMEYIRSLSRCKTWGAQGGKSKAYFAKTLDDRFIVKQVSSPEKYSFLEFAPQYFRHLWESMSSGSPTCLAKIVGFYTVTVRKGGKEREMDLIVMENLTYGKTISRIYDLKGSLRSRYNPDTTGTLLDQNLLEDMPTSPIFMTNKSKLLLERAVFNDTSFLARVNVMDYSLLAVVSEDRQELVIGIIDYIRQYTWDKHLETWVKASGILGGSKNTTPTVVSPKEYKKRFRKAISSYFVVVPESEAPPLLSIGNPPPSSRDSSSSPEPDSQPSTGEEV